MLSDTEIKREISNGNIIIEPLNLNAIGPNSIDFTLFGQIKIPCTTNIIKLKSPQVPEYEELQLPYCLNPGKMILGATNEVMELKGHMGLVMQRSNFSRLGLHILSIPNIDAGFKGRLSVVMKNESLHGIEIAEGVRIFQVGFFPVKNVSTNYMDRALSKNTHQTIGEVPTYKPDKEWL